MSSPPPTPLSSIIDWRKVGLLAAIVLPVMVLWSTPLVWPLKILVVFFHELSHGLAAILTGGSIERIEVVAAQGGVCWTMGGSRFLILTAGYLGSLLWGGLVLLAASSSRRDRGVAIGLGAVIILATLLWVRPLLSFGFGFHLLAGLALVLAGALLPDSFNDIILKLIGVTSCLYVIPDIYSDTIARSYLRSDARMLAEMTHIPTVIWGGAWILLALTVTGGLVVVSCRKTVEVAAK